MASAARSVQVLVPAGRAAPAEAVRGRARRAELSLSVAPSRLRPRGVGEILDSGVELLSGSFAQLVGTVFLLWLPGGALLVLSVRYSFWTGLVLQSAVTVAVQTLSVAMLAGFLFERVQGREGAILRSALTGIARSPGYALIAFLTAVISAPFVCCFGIGTYVPQGLLSVAPIVYVLEGLGVFPSMLRSVRLVGRSFFRWLGWFVVLGAMSAALTSSANLHAPNVRAWILDALPMGEGAYDVFALVLSSAFLAVHTAFLAAVIVVFYIDLRVRREGLDLDLELSRMAARRAP